MADFLNSVKRVFVRRALSTAAGVFSEALWLFSTRNYTQRYGERLVTVIPCKRKVSHYAQRIAIYAFDKTSAPDQLTFLRHLFLPE